MIQSNPSSENILEDLENPPLQQDKTSEILNNLDKLLESMKKNTSVLSRMADIWGKLSSWLKIAGGLLLFGPLLIIGILTVSTILVVSTCVCTLLYALTGWLLDNHCGTVKNIHAELKAEILSLGHLLSEIIDELNDTSQKLSTEVDRLNAEISALSTLNEKMRADHESTIAQLNKAIADTELQNKALGRMVNIITDSFTKNEESNDKYKASFEQLLNSMQEGKEDFFQKLGSLLQLEENMEAIQQRIFDLLENYEALVIAHKQPLEMINGRKTCSRDVQTEPVPFAYYSERVLKGIITPISPDNDNGTSSTDMMGNIDVVPETNSPLSAGV